MSTLTPRASRTPGAAVVALMLLLGVARAPHAQQGAAKTAPQTPRDAFQAFPQLWTGPELSAEYVGRNEDGSPARSRVYFGKDKMRWDAVETGNRKSDAGALGSTIIVDYAKGTAYLIDPAKKQYMEGAELSQMMLAMMGIVRLVFQPADVNNPCLMWYVLAAESQPKDRVDCKNQGGDAVNGRSAVKYELSDATNGRAQLWLDKQTHLIIRMRDDKTQDEVDVVNLREASQPASLFEVPAGYNKVDVSMGSILSSAFKRPAREGQAKGDSSGGKGVGAAVKDAGKDVAGSAAEATKDAAKEAAKEKAAKKVRGMFKLP